MAKNEHK